ncbi:hypothetical protein [Bacillus testis]|uniref:hypothetical protein n=1 Tax=Bacillus testis TaxID=1622072 RepID=UPI00067F1FC6|nr:hypothetical protein [Bacillus testis]
MKPQDLDKRYEQELIDEMFLEREQYDGWPASKKDSKAKQAFKEKKEKFRKRMKEKHSPKIP